MKKYQYKKYPNAHLIDNWEQLITLTREQVEKIMQEWVLIEKENEELSKFFRTELNNKIEHAVKNMAELDIDVYNYKKKGYSVVRSGYKAWFKKNVVDVISADYPDNFPYVPKAHMATKMVHGIEIYNNQSPTDLVTLHWRVTSEYRYKQNQVQETKLDLLKAQEWVFLNPHIIDIAKLANLTDKEIINKVTDLAKDKYLQDAIKPGDKIPICSSDCDCGSYTVGDNRCDCGNVRISLEVEGSLSEGFYINPERY